MTTLAKMIRSIDDFLWMGALEKELDHMLEGLDESNRENCKRHFMKIIEASIMRNEPDKYGRSLLMDTHSEVLGIRGEVQNLTMGMQILLDEQLRRNHKSVYIPDRSGARIAKLIFIRKRIRQNPNFIYRVGI